MTLVAIWHERAEDSLWAIADTQISQTSPPSTLTDRGVKIFPLQVTCYHPENTDGWSFFSRLARRQSIGFAYAGSTLPAIMTYSVAANCLQNLNGLDAYRPPSLEDVALLIRRLSAHYMRQVMEAHSGHDGGFTALVFGKCLKTNVFRVFEISESGLPEKFSVSMNEKDLSAGAVITIGDSAAKEGFQNKLSALIASGKPRRAPRNALETLIQEGVVKSIGGELQLGIVQQTDFSLYYLARPLTEGRPEAKRLFCGLDVDTEIGEVGDYTVGLDGMA